MDAATLVSVSIPCYNQAHFLRDAIESVLAQTHSHFELIVVDDGATDNTAEVAARYPGVRYVRQENQGLSAARNTGLRVSRGGHLVFLDADDRLLPHALETNFGHLAAHPECAFVSGHHRLIGPDGSPMASPYQQPHVKSDHYLTLLRGNYIGCPATVMYRRGVFDAVGGFDTSLKSCEDYHLYLRVARRFPVHCHNEVIAEYRVHDANMSSNYRRMLDSATAALRSQWEYVEGNQEYERAYRSGMKHYRALFPSLELVAEMRAGARAGEWRRAMPAMLALLWRHPGVFAENIGRKLRSMVTDGRS